MLHCVHALPVQVDVCDMAPSVVPDDRKGWGVVEAGPGHSGCVCWARLDPCMLCGFVFFTRN